MSTKVGEFFEGKISICVEIALSNLMLYRLNTKRAQRFKEEPTEGSSGLLVSL